MLARFFLLGIGPFFHCELETDERHPNLHIIILVGGLISSLIVREPGESFWAALSDTPLEELDLSPEARRLIEDTVKFAPRSDIARVIYVTTPHRGSPIPHNPLINRAIRFKCRGPSIGETGGSLSKPSGKSCGDSSRFRRTASAFSNPDR